MPDWVERKVPSYDLYRLFPKKRKPAQKGKNTIAKKVGAKFRGHRKGLETATYLVRFPDDDLRLLRAWMDFRKAMGDEISVNHLIIETWRWYVHEMKVRQKCIAAGWKERL